MTYKKGDFMYDKKIHLWDKKSKTFPRYSEELNPIQKAVFDILKRLDLKLSDKSLIDIGCGTGVWTLHLAQKVKSITALDASQGMLEILKEDANKLNLNNISFTNLNFESFYKNAKEEFDIAFASMSPALNKDEDYKAFLKLAPLRVYVGWEEYRQSDFLMPILKAFGAKQKYFDENDMENFLKCHDISFEKHVFEETRHNQKTREVAIENAMWHLNMAGIEPNINELERFVQTETINEVVKSKIKLLVF